MTPFSHIIRFNKLKERKLVSDAFFTKPLIPPQLLIIYIPRNFIFRTKWNKCRPKSSAYIVQFSLIPSSKGGTADKFRFCSSINMIRWVGLKTNMFCAGLDKKVHAQYTLVWHNLMVKGIGKSLFDMSRGE